MATVAGDNYKLQPSHLVISTKYCSVLIHQEREPVIIRIIQSTEQPPQSVIDHRHLSFPENSAASLNKRRTSIWDFEASLT